MAGSQHTPGGAWGATPTPTSPLHALATTRAADGSSSDQRTSGAPTPTAGLSLSREAARLVPPLPPWQRQRKRTQLGRELAPVFSDERIQAPGWLEGGEGGVQRHQTRGRPAQSETPRRRGSVAWPMILHRHPCGQQTLPHSLAHARGQREPRPRAFQDAQKTRRGVRRSVWARGAGSHLPDRGHGPTRLARRAPSGWLPPGRVGL